MLSIPSLLRSPQQQIIEQTQLGRHALAAISGNSVVIWRQVPHKLQQHPAWNIWNRRTRTIEVTSGKDRSEHICSRGKYVHPRSTTRDTPSMLSISVRTGLDSCARGQPQATSSLLSRCHPPANDPTSASLPKVKGWEYTSSSSNTRSWVCAAQAYCKGEKINEDLIRHSLH